jgi:hypothetical protein
MGKAQAVFHEEQPFKQRYAKFSLATPPAALLFITIRQVFFHHPWGNPPVTNGDLIFLSVLLVLVYLRLITVRLVTDLWPSEIAVGLYGLWRRRKIPMSQVRAAKMVEYDPIRDYGGYGIRSGLRGQAYIAGGSAGVELELQDGERLLIGSREPARLAKQITACRLGSGK